MDNRSEIRSGVNDAAYASRQVFLKIVLPIILLIGCTTVFCTVVMRPFQVADKLTNPDRMIYTYERFFNLYEKVNAASQKIRLKEQQIKMFLDTVPAGWRKDMSLNRDYQMLVVELSGLKEHRTNLVAEYNANSKKATQNFLKDNSLPERLQ